MNDRISVIKTARSMTKVASANIVDKVLSHAVPVEVLRGVFVAFVGSKVCQLFMSETKDFAANILIIMMSCIWNIITVYYIFPLLDKNFVHADPI